MVVFANCASLLCPSRRRSQHDGIPTPLVLSDVLRFLRFQRLFLCKRHSVSIRRLISSHWHIVLSVWSVSVPSKSTFHMCASCYSPVVPTNLRNEDSLHFPVQNCASVDMLSVAGACSVWCACVVWCGVVGKKKAINIGKPVKTRIHYFAHVFRHGVLFQTAIFAFFA